MGSTFYAYKTIEPAAHTVGRLCSEQKMDGSKLRYGMGRGIDPTAKAWTVISTASMVRMPVKISSTAKTLKLDMESAIAKLPQIVSRNPEAEKMEKLERMIY